VSVERIDEQRCTGCGTCVDSCPMDVLRMDDELLRAVIVYPQDCGLCAMCEVDCPEQAVYVAPSRVTPIPTCWGS
jgi:NAD-dependent dihydropyrimidine dehydrogenase PreA subunit